VNKYAVLGALVIVILVTGIMGAHFGYSVDGVPQGVETSDEEPGLLSGITYAFSSIGFLFSMVLFRVDGMPVWMSAIFIFMGIMSIMLIVSLIRGTE